MNNIIVAVDIGSTKIATIIAKINPDGRIHVLGDGLVSCKAIKKFAYVDETSITKAIKKSVEQAQKKAGVIVHSLYVNIHGIYLNYIKNEASITFEDPDKEITKSDVYQLIKKSTQFDIFEDEKIVDVIPLKFIINDETVVNDPIGLHGQKLTVEADVVVGLSDIVKTICMCVQKAGYVVDGVIPEATAVKDFILTPAEKKECTLLVDVGGTLTEVSIYNKNNVVYNSTIPIGGEHITSDVAKVFSIAVSEAESIKRELRIAHHKALDEDKDIPVYILNKGTTEIIKASSIVEVMEARIYEIFEKVIEKIDESAIELDSINNLVLIGEGLKKFDGVDFIISEMLKLKARNVKFFVETGYAPVYTVAYCMVNYLNSCLDLGRNFSMVATKTNVEAYDERENPGLVKRLVGLIKEFFSLK